MIARDEPQAIHPSTVKRGRIWDMPDCGWDLESGRWLQKPGLGLFDVKFDTPGFTSVSRQLRLVGGENFLPYLPKMSSTPFDHHNHW